MNNVRAVYGKQNDIPRFPWTSIGTLDETASHGDASLTVGERDFLSIKDLDNCVWFIVPACIANLLARLVFVAGTDDDTADIAIWVGTLLKAPDKDATADCVIRRIATYDVIAGTAQGIVATELFADTATEANDVSISGCTTKTVANEMAVVHIPVEGFNLICFHGFGTFECDVRVELAGYS